jgi:two-component system, OmpR family, response regulator CpxR
MKIKVLLVDDEKDFVETLAQRLEARNLSVTKAFGGDEALARLQEEDIDVAVVDMLMPGKTGIEVLMEIKQIRPLVEVILLTGHATVESAIEGMTKGAFYYLMKPAELKSLLQYIAYAYKHKAEHEHRIRQAEIDRLLYSEVGS